MSSKRCSLLQEASQSANSMMATTIRSVLCEAASQTLKHRVQTKRKTTSLERDKKKHNGDDTDIDTDTSSHNSDDSAPTNTSSKSIKSSNKPEVIPIQNLDIDIAYDAAIEIGQKWKEKLVVVGERNLADIVDIVVQNGHFLEHDFVDDLSSLSVVPLVADQSINKNTENTEVVDVSENDRNNSDNGSSGEDLTLNNNSDKGTTEHDEHDDEQNSLSHEISGDTATQPIEQREQSMDKVMEIGTTTSLLHNDNSFTAFGILSSLGCRDPCNLEHLDMSNNDNVVQQQPSASKWTPLPADGANNNNNSFAHHPRATILPHSQIKPIPPNQLFGRPAQSLLKTVVTDNSSSSALEDRQKGIHHYNPNNLSKEERENFAKAQIKILDKFCTTRNNSIVNNNNDSNTNTRGYSPNITKAEEGLLWNYGWEMIQNAAERNHNRLFLETIAGRKRKIDLNAEQNHVLVPKSVMTLPSLPGSNIETYGAESTENDDDEDVGDANVSTSVQIGMIGKQSQVDSVGEELKEADKNDVGLEKRQLHHCQIVPLTQILASRSHNHLKRKAILKPSGRRAKLSSTNKDGNTEEQQRHQEHKQRGREASLMPSSVQFTWDDVTSSFSESDLKRLERTMIHPTDEEEMAAESSYHQVQGALKFLGNIHMWEQVRSGDWDGPIDGENDDMEELEEEDTDQIHRKRKRAHIRARKQRLGSHDEILKGTDKANNSAKVSSKVVWAQGPKKRTMHTEFEDDDNEYWMELDLGECSIRLMATITLSSSLPGVNQLVFRSLEVSLRESDE